VWYTWWICVVLASAALALVAPQTVSASDAGQAAASEVSEASYRYFLGDSLGVAGILYTHDGDDRGYGLEHDLARDNIEAEFQSFGLGVVLHPFTYSSTTYYNVVATQVGTVYPNQEYIIGAHYDSVSNPGADDNASGVAAVLEAARILSQYDSEYTIRYIAFDREEQGLVGSDAYATDYSSSDILGMISLDMVSFNPGTDQALIFGRTASDPIKSSLAAAVNTYGQGISPTITGPLDGSDHAPFEWQGFQACLIIEGDYSLNPNYHTQDDSVDTPGYIDYDFARRMTRSVVGWLVDHAVVDVPIDALDFIYPNGRPEYVDPVGGTVMRVEVVGLGTEVPQPGTGVLHYNLGGGWQTSPMKQASPNVYDATFPAANCGDEILYYVSATAFGGTPYTDPWDAPAGVFSAIAGYGQIVSFEDDFDADPLWTTEGDWAFGQPTGGGGAYGGPDPTGGFTGTNVYGYNLAGDYTNSMPERHLTSTAIDCSGRFGVHLNFRRWLGVEQPSYDHAYVRVSNNGTDWVTVWENLVEIADTDWQEMDLDISAVADDQSTVYLRWTMGLTDTAWTYCGWNIDDVQLVGLNCNPPADGDHDDDQDVDLYDIGWFQMCLSGDGNAYPAGMGCEVFDFEPDGDVDLTDYAEVYGLCQGSGPL